MIEYMLKNEINNIYVGSFSWKLFKIFLYGILND